jgi:hypothetical protein
MEINLNYPKLLAKIISNNYLFVFFCWLFVLYRGSRGFGSPISFFGHPYMSFSSGSSMLVSQYGMQISSSFHRKKMKMKDSLYAYAAKYFTAGGLTRF